MIIDGIEFKVEPIKTRERIENVEIAKYIARTHNRINKDYKPLHLELFNTLKENYPDVKNHTLTNYYIPSLDLYIDDCLDKNHNFNLYKPSSGIHRRFLNELIEKNEEEMIRTWCIKDSQKAKQMEELGHKYVMIYSFKNKEDILNQIRWATEDLIKEYSHDEMRNELKNILTKPGDFSAGCNHNRITLTYNKHFYDTEQKMFKQITVRRWILELLQKYLVREYEIDIKDGEILQQFRISRLCDGFSQHSPLWAKAFIEKYDIKSIYDPTGGWGHRLLGTWKIPYIYNDTDIRSVNGVKTIYERFKDDPLYGTKAPKEFYNNDAALFTPQTDYDAVYTCPPYFLVEEYFGENTSTKTHPNYNSWLNVWWYNVVKSSVKPTTRIFSFIINNKYNEDMKNIVLKPEFNLEFIEEIKLNKDNNVNHFHRIPTDDPNKPKILKNISKGEKLLVFRKK